MAVKKRKLKKKKMQELIDNSVKIACRNCSIKKDCKTRATKEKSEKLGITTYCTLTPCKRKRVIKRKSNAK